MPEILAEAARVIEDRIADIDEQLTRFNTLRSERAELAAALRRLQPKEKRTNGSVNGAPSLKTVLRQVFDSDKKAELTITDVLSAVELAGWKSGAADPECDHPNDVRPTRARWRAQATARRNLQGMTERSTGRGAR